MPDLAHAKAKELEERLRLLEDIEKIRELKYNYCYAVDRQDPDTIANLFTSDALWDGDSLGVYRGRKEIKRYFKKVVPLKLKFVVHMAHNPLIEVHGDEAKGTWYWTEPCTLVETGKATWIMGRYDDEYVKAKGSWKFKKVKLTFNYVTSFDKGWEEENRADSL